MALSPRPDGYVTLAGYHFKAKRMAEARAAAAKALEMDPLHGGVYVLYGDVFAVQGRFEEAIVAFQKALEIDPSRQGITAQQKIDKARAILAERKKKLPTGSNAGGSKPQSAP